MQTFAIPITMGHNRLRSHRTGALVDESQGLHLQTLRAVFADEARRQKVDPTQDWLATATRQILDLYERAYREWQANPNDTVGFIYEATMSSGTRLLLGDQRALDRLPAQYSGSPVDEATESPESGPR